MDQKKTPYLDTFLAVFWLTFTLLSTLTKINCTIKFELQLALKILKEIFTFLLRGYIFLISHLCLYRMSQGLNRQMPG